MEEPWYGKSPERDHQQEGAGKDMPFRASIQALSDHVTSIRDTLTKSQKISELSPSKSASRDSIDQLYASGSQRLEKYAKLDDLINLSGPLTEDTIIKTLHARFLQEKYSTRVGSVTIDLNPHLTKSAPVAMTQKIESEQLIQTCHEVVQEVSDSQHSQTLVLTGNTMTGKTHLSQCMIKYLVENYSADKEMFKHLQAALTVLHPLCHTKGGSSMGMYTQLFVDEYSIIHFKLLPLICGLNKINTQQGLKECFEIFDVILSGMSNDEKKKFHLDNYMSQTGEQKEIRRHLGSWKASLAVLGIPYADMLRVLSAIILLNDLHFLQGETREPDVYQPNNELKSVAALLGISAVTLYKCLTTVTKTYPQQKVIATPQIANQSKQALCKTLYHRMINSILHRIDIIRSSHLKKTRPGYTVEGKFVGILDLFGFHSEGEYGLETLCKNLTMETVQQLYTTVVFRNVLHSIEEEGVLQDVDVDYTDNGTLVDLLSMEKEGLISLLNEECRTADPSIGSLLHSYHACHKHSPWFKGCQGDTFTLRHTAGTVTYKTTHMISDNEDKIIDDVIWAFSKRNCNFGFMSYLFSKEMKAMLEGPRGVPCRIAATPSDGKSSFSKDFLEKLNSIVKLVMLTRPHFVLCLDSNKDRAPQLFDRENVLSQVRQLQLLPTVQLFAAGYPHKIRYRQFSDKYKLLLGSDINLEPAKSLMDETRIILDSYLRLMDEELKMPYVSAHWAYGSKHIFFTESCRQNLERVRKKKKEQAAIVIQSQWRCRVAVKQWPSLKQHLKMLRQRTPPHGNIVNHRTPPQTNINTKRTSPQNANPHYEIMNRNRQLSGSLEETVYNISGEAQNMYLDQPPALPPPRNYTVQGNIKASFPQTRIMLQDFAQHEGRVSNMLHKGQEIKVTGYSDRRGCVTVNNNNLVYHVPYQLTKLQLSNVTPGTGVNI